MTLSNLFNPINSQKLLGFDDKFNFLVNLELNEKLPKVILFSGEKGLGKSTFVHHFMHYFFDKDNYDISSKAFPEKSNFHSQYKNNLFSNVLYLHGANFSNTKVEDVRILKENLLKTPILKEKRFIILDDVDRFNLNSLNALLKIIEEPNINNYFILINNKSKILLDTIRSRCLEIKILFNNEKRNKIISSLLKIFDQKNFLDINLVKISPGDYIKFNYFFLENKISLDEDFINNFKVILNFYKKEKDPYYKNILTFLFEYYLQKNKISNHKDRSNFVKNRLFILKNINDFFIYILVKVR